MRRGGGGGRRGRRGTCGKLTEALLWSLRYSPGEIAYLEHKQAPVLDQRVEPGSWFYWQAFHHLRGSRHDGGAIPFAAMATYSDWLGQTCPVERGRLVRMVMRLDNAEREHNGRTATSH
jgi:hypothetical protein